MSFFPHKTLTKRLDDGFRQCLTRASGQLVGQTISFGVLNTEGHGTAPFFHKGNSGLKPGMRQGRILVDPAGIVRWVNLTEDLRVRARPETVLAAFDQLQGKPPAQ
jgi:hypothetical protein